MTGIDSSIYFQQQTPDFLGSIQRGLNLAQLADERALRQTTMQENKDLQDAMRGGIIQNPDGTLNINTDTTFARMAQVNPLKAYEFKQQHEESLLKSQKAKLDQQMNQVDLTSRLLSGVNDQPSFDRAMQTAQKFGIDSSPLGKYYDPDLVKQYQAMSMTAKDNLSYQQSLMENAFKEKELGFKQQDLEARVLENKAKALKESTGMASELRKERSGLPTTRNTQEVAAAYNKIQSAAKYNNDPVADLSLVYNYMKMLDPGSTVREGEYATAKNAKGVPDQVMDAYNNAIRGTLLNPVQRNQFLNQSKNLYQAQIDVQKQVDSQYSNLAKKSGIAPEDVIVRFDANSPKPKSVIQNGHTYELNPETGQYE